MLTTTRLAQRGLLQPVRRNNVQMARRSVWSTGKDPVPATHPLHSLTPSEIVTAAFLVKGSIDNARFVAVSLKEHVAKRCAEVVVLNSKTGIASELTVDLDDSAITERTDLPRGTQPLLTPDDCFLAESIVKKDENVRKLLLDRYGIDDMQKQVAADPWSVHLACEGDAELTEPADPSLPPRRLVQTFLYQRMHGTDLQDNHYAHPIPILPVVDLNTQQVVQIDGLDNTATIPTLSVNYHNQLLHTNSYLQSSWRQNALKALDIAQPDGTSFTVEDSNFVTWQNWTFRVGFNYREGLVLHDLKFNGRSVVQRASLVEMAVPYADPNPPFSRKCAFDVGDYGLGYCANSLELGCDCLGHIHYFDAYLNDAAGNPKCIPKVICMHEEDAGILYKHVEFRNGHNESRRARELVISSIATVVNYEYLFYWRLKLDGSIDFEIRLSGELSTNLVSVGEDPESPSHGVLVAPGVNAQIHQHMFCARLDMAVDGTKNTVSEVDIVPEPLGEKNPFGNAFNAAETVLRTELQAVRTYDATKARTWKISNGEGKLNPITKKPVAYKLIPFTKGAAQPALLTHPEKSTVSTKGAFAKAHLWVTPFAADERFPAGEYTPQAKEPAGLPIWTKANRPVEKETVVLWHAFGVTHVPRVEDFPVMPCEMTGFTLKPDGFSNGNPAIDMPPETNKKSTLNQECCAKQL
jgi:primary-amine oxidase